MADIEVKLVKEMGYERIDCTCGMAVVPKDPTPELTQMVKRTSREEGAAFSIIDTTAHPAVLNEYEIAELPCVIIGMKVYRAEEPIIRQAIRKEKARKRQSEERESGEASLLGKRKDVSSPIKKEKG